MPRTLRIPLSPEAADELEDAFIDDEKTDSHQFVWQQIRALCRDAKMTRLSHTLQYHEMGADGKLISKSEKLNLDDIPKLPNAPDWKPDSLGDADVRYFEHMVTDRTWEYLVLFAALAARRQRKYVESLARLDEKRLAELDGKDRDRFAKVVAENREHRVKTIPRNIEEVVYMSLEKPITDMITANIDRLLDKENEQMYPPKKEQKA